MSRVLIGQGAMFAIAAAMIAGMDHRGAEEVRPRKREPEPEIDPIMAVEVERQRQKDWEARQYPSKRASRRGRGKARRHK